MAPKQKKTLAEKIANACLGLVYISETDSEVEPFFGGRSDGTEIVKFAAAAGIEPPAEIGSASFDDFFERLSRERDWHSDRDARNAKGFAKLYKILSKHLTDRRLYRVGEIRIEIYAVGIDANGNMRGVRMRAVET